MSSSSRRRGYHKFILGRTEFEVDVRYMNLKPIGRGAYGLVASADDLITGQKVAIKRISRVFQDLIDAKRILREIKLLSHLGKHENIVDIMDIMTGPPEAEQFETLYIVTKLYECDLERIIQSSQKLTDQHYQYFIFQVLRGMKFIHSANVLHRDLKPSNLLVNSNCDLAVCDFGLARGVADDVEELTGYVVTRWYRAPELLCDSSNYGGGVDVWSIGCIFAELMARRPLFRGANTRDQLQLIISVLGTPTSDEIKYTCGSESAMKTITRMPRCERVPFASMFPGANPQAIDILERMLVFDPRKRLSIDDALSHPYFRELYSKATLPTCDSHFNFDFEKAYPDEMPKPLLQKYMYEDMMQLRGEQERKGYARVGGSSSKR